MKTGTKKQMRIDRRKFLQIVAVAGAAGAGWTLGLSRRTASYKVVQKSEPMMGTILNLTLYGPDRSVLETAIETTIDRMHGLENILSRHNPASDLARLNRTGTLTNPSRDLTTVLELARFVNDKTGGAFDVTVLPLVKLQQKGKVPEQADIQKALALTGFHHLSIDAKKITLARAGMGITLDGIGKGYIVDQGVETLRENGFGSAYVEAGGDLMVTGRKPGDQPWRIGIRNPRPSSSGELMVLKTSNHAVATSGDYMQAYATDYSRHHIVNPRTGYSPPELASATITAPTVALADGLATAAMVMGHKRSIAMLRNMPNCEGYFIDKGLNHYQSAGFSG
ncbi:MAG TPA: FAD:protein FMN transferase [Desulfobulbaceae bacterium]|nr:FAD:protein FMN transferase [Desulfobulbaceae bacterium]